MWLPGLEVTDEEIAKALEWLHGDRSSARRHHAGLWQCRLLLRFCAIM
jgi:hypothetical protein